MPVALIAAIHIFPEILALRSVISGRIRSRMQNNNKRAAIKGRFLADASSSHSQRDRWPAGAF
ncbi:hypothetical protein TcasGA2_TC014576 [Tribolium castaneum]|uniref:Uncharacterized protein n=1 Tax=Tribolium castaneum TaxID=7070 RepID=D6WMK6_TRICA|nr:hypothetical protein TcasGA2_TC014576 [Tribolium castaneum]